MKLRSFYCYSINHVPFIFPLLPEHVYLVVVMDGRRSERVPSFDVTSFRATFQIGALNSLTAELCAYTRDNTFSFIISLFPMAITYLPRNVSFPTINVSMDKH